MHWLTLLQTIIHFDQHLGTAITDYGTLVYMLLFGLVFCEIAFLPLFFLPGDPLLFVAGAFCVNGGLNLWALMAVLWLATVTGSMVNYAIGRALANKVFTHDYRWLDKAALQKTHAFYENRGGATFLISPFIAVLRTFAPFVGGVAQMRWQRFLAYTAIGALIWAVLLPCAGYFFGNVPFIRQSLGLWVLAGMGLGLGGVVLGGLWRWYKRAAA